MSESKIVLTINDKLKNDSEDLFFSLGLNLETAISMFLTKAVNEGGIPFEVKQAKYVESPNFISSHFTIKSALYEVNEYLKDRFNEEPSFHLACDTKGVEHEDIGKLFILFSKNTENINQEDFTTNHIDSLVELAITAVPSIKRLSSDQLRDIVNAFINNYYLIR
ncbi:type II toxin-antitoxin system RelB/DinJ family antitoxin [uncultured Gemella sp.]|uniref:type II toxin-antitoxin system RelB/DinJ family antitoxin n=1 Tax=uncultured Gemella sp. TaxID=254352 RepID=UPI0028D78D99|nr:type II toxin-antitoxin system RelB/DinJ family antitoxin [uncultured Gemella sp.]